MKKVLLFLALVTLSGAPAKPIGSSPPPPSWWDTPVSDLDNCQALNSAGMTPQAFMNAASYFYVGGQTSMAISLVNVANIEADACGWNSPQELDLVDYFDQMLDDALQNLCDEFGCG